MKKIKVLLHSPFLKAREVKSFITKTDKCHCKYQYMFTAFSVHSTFHKVIFGQTDIITIINIIIITIIIIS